MCWHAHAELQHRRVLQKNECGVTCVTCAHGVYTNPMVYSKALRLHEPNGVQQGTPSEVDLEGYGAAHFQLTTSLHRQVRHVVVMHRRAGLQARSKHSSARARAQYQHSINTASTQQHNQRILPEPRGQGQRATSITSLNHSCAQAARSLWNQQRKQTPAYSVSASLTNGVAANGHAAAALHALHNVPQH